ncbi:MAG: arsenite methyltransferase [Dehalococcoidia bacterium]|nr:arsenite methyltransferase [Dehalococcoidia bacterium]
MAQDVRKAVRESYGKVAKRQGSCCGPAQTCGGDAVKSRGRQIGYTEHDLAAAPDGSNLGLGCGNPVALASLKKGEVVLDLGSGGGFDCFLAAKKVGSKGKVIGVDMTPEMLARARENAAGSEYKNIEFRLGEIENLPVADNSVDVIISNCVINLSPDKKRVFAEAFRVLRPGGRLMVSDMVLEKELPDFVKESAQAYVGCVAGAMLKKDYLDAARQAGFQEVKIVGETTIRADQFEGDPMARSIAEDMGLSQEQIRGLLASVVSAKVYAVKPG